MRYEGGRSRAFFQTVILLWVVLGSGGFPGDVCATEEAESPAAGAQEEGKKLVVGTKEAPPFSYRGPDGSWQGLSVELWEEIAQDLDLEYTWRELALDELLTGVADGSLDLSVAALTITPEREAMVDFSHPFHISGLGIATTPVGKVTMTSILLGMVNLQFLRALGSLSLVLLVAGFFLWLFERRRNPEQFGGSAAHGLGAAFWWSAVTMTTVGYGDKAPMTFGGRVVALVWMFASIIMISGFTAAITSALTVGNLSSKIKGPEDLQQVRVGSVESTTSAIYLEEIGIAYRGYDDLDAALAGVVAGKIDAVVYDAPILNWTVRQDFAGKIEVLDVIFERQDYGIALGFESPLREPLNRVLLEKIQDSRWGSLVERYAGN